MQYTGEILALGVAMLWTATALCFEYSGKKMGTLPLNLIRIFMAFVMLGTLLLCTTGSILPLYAGGQTWLWLSVSGLIGFVIGDYFLFYSYILIGSRFTQLLMTLAPPASAIGGALILGESMGLNAIAGMIITITGIILSIVGKKDKIDDKNQRSYGLKLPTKGLLLAIGAGLCQGIGIVFSKLGLNYYSSDLTSHFSVFPDSNHEKIITDMIPFASSQIRLITGLVGFAILVLFTGKTKQLFAALKMKKAMGIATIGTLFGPFLGVSFSLMAIQYTATGIASTLMALTPIIIMLPAHYIFKQKITYLEIAGAFISVIGVMLFFI